MATLPQLLWVVLAPAALGVLALRAVGLRFADDRLGYLGWSWAGGCLVLGAALFGYVALSIEPWLWWTAPCFAALVLALVGARRRPAPPLPARSGGGWLVPAFAVAGAGWCVLHFVAAAARPSVEGDEGNIWTMKAKSLFVDWYEGVEVFGAAQVWNLHPDYPMLDPLLQAWVYAGAGEVVQFANRLPVQLCALALWLAMVAGLRRRAPGWLACGLAAVVLLSTQFRWLCLTSYADGMVALGLVLALDGWLRFRATGHAPWRWLSAGGAALALWSKNEAALYAVAVAGAAALAVLTRRAALRPPTAAAVRALLLPLCVVTAQVIWNRSLALQNDLFGANPLGRSLPELVIAQFGERAPAVLAAALAQVTDVAREFGVLLVALLSVAIWPRAALGRALFVPTVALLASYVGLHVVYVGSHLDLQRHLATSHDRVVFQLVPAAMVWFAALFATVRPRSGAALAAGAPARHDAAGGPAASAS